MFHFLRCHFVIFEQCCPLFKVVYETLQTTNVNMKFVILLHISCQNEYDYLYSHK